ncbi:LuxR C-terminal-related transcriptional regulator [Pirellulaceae bacterium SH449]
MIQEPLQSLHVSTDSQFAIRILSQPSLVLLDLAKSSTAPFSLFSRDLFGRFLFISPSAESVLDRSANELIQFSLLAYLTDNPCNQKLRQAWGPKSSAETGSFLVEIYGSHGEIVRAELTEIAIRSEHKIIGYAGFIKRAELTEHALATDVELDDREVMQRAASLSKVERQVAELVVDGHMNKRMANILDVAVRTIETRRARVMSKMRAKSLPHLVQMWLRVRQIEAESKISRDFD